MSVLPDFSKEDNFWDFLDASLNNMAYSEPVTESTLKG